MSYLVLARKSRPATFDQVVGQQAVVRTLKNALKRQRVPHGLIFSGIRGTGKTTLARIMAKALNCEHGPTPDPCTTCQPCREIAAGSAVDLHEIDGASNRGIQEIRDLKENIRFMPTSARFKIIIIDEVHMLTTEAFNALLKTLEEPPDHVYFMFATTELHKVPVTILSRCQRYELQRVGSEELSAHFLRLAEQEGVSVDQEAIRLIVRESGGSVRDGLSLLDQVFSYCGERVSASDVVEILGLVSHEVIADLGEALLTQDVKTVLELLARVHEHGLNIKRFCADLLTWFRNLLLCGLHGEPAQVLDLPGGELERLRRAAKSVPVETVSAMFTLLVQGLERVQTATRPRMVLEAALLQAVQAGDIQPMADLLTRFDRVLAGLPRDGSGQASRPQPAEGPAPVADPEPVTAKEPPPGPAPADVEPDSAPLPDEDRGGHESARGQQAGEQMAETVSGLRGTGEEQKQETGRQSVRDVRKEWPDFIRYVHERKPWMAASLKMASSVTLDAEELLISFDEAANCRMLKNRDNIRLLTEFALDFFQGSFTVGFRVPEGDGCAVDPEGTASARAERQALAQDDLVLAALDVFNGQIGDIRVGPRFRTPLTGAADAESAPPGGNGETEPETETRQ